MSLFHSDRLIIRMKCTFFYHQSHFASLFGALRHNRQSIIHSSVFSIISKTRLSALIGLLILLVTSCSQNIKEAAYPNSKAERKVISDSPEDSVTERLALAVLIGAAVYGMERVNEASHRSAAHSGAAFAQASTRPLIVNRSADLDRVIRRRACDPRQAQRALIEAAGFNEQVVRFVRSSEEKVHSVGVKSATTLNRVLADIGQVVCLRRQWLLYLKDSEKNQNLARSYQERIRVLENYKCRLEVLVRDSLPESV